MWIGYNNGEFYKIDAVSSALAFYFGGLGSISTKYLYSIVLITRLSIAYFGVRFLRM